MRFSTFGVVLTGLIVLASIVVGRLVLRAILRAMLRITPDEKSSLDWRERILLRYQDQDMHAWMFAWFKTRLDPMFDELREFLGSTSDIRTLLDLGCGFGFAGSFLLDRCPRAQIYAIEPSSERVAGAARAFGARGHVYRGAAPDFEVAGLPGQFDAVFVLDVIHFLPDAGLNLTLRRIRARMDEGGLLFLRVPMKPLGFGSFIFNVDRILRTLKGSAAHYRTAQQLRDALTAAGFCVTHSQMSGGNPELFWFVAKGSVVMEEREAMEAVPVSGQHERQDQT